MAAIVGLNVDMKSSGRGEALSIGDVAQRFGLATHVLRHWEAMGLLAPVRVEGARRRYSRDDLYRIALILRAKEAGFGLEDIRSMFAAQDPSSRRKVLRRRRAELARRIAEMRVSLDLIDSALGCGHEDIAECPHFRALIVERIGGEGHLRVRT